MGIMTKQYWSNVGPILGAIEGARGCVGRSKEARGDGEGALRGAESSQNT